jgi:hypothetical protein
MLAQKISQTGLTRAMSEPFAVALTDEEINGVLIAVVAVRYSVLPEEGCRLNEEVACLSSLGSFGKLFGAY